MNTKVISSMARLQLLGGALVSLAVLCLAACGDDSKGSRKDAATGRPYDAATLDSTTDRATGEAPAGCWSNGKLYGVGEVFLVMGTCPAPAVCQCIANGQTSCLNSCPTDGATPDERPTSDAPLTVTCASGGQLYAPGDNVPSDGTCRGACVCMSDGTLGHCSGTCADAGPTPPILDAARERADSAPDRAERDAPPTLDMSIGPYDGASDRSGVDRIGVDRGGDLAADRVAYDGACATGSPCTLANGNKGICPSGTCRACTGTSDDNACVTAYGSGNICVENQCVAGTCHDSKGCATGKKVCDANHTCQSCTSDQQCKNDTNYGNGTICQNSQCVTGTCHTSTDCQGKKLCSATAHTCSACTTDANCQADTVYGSTSICVSGQCESAACTATADCRTWNRLCPATGTNRICAACTSNTQCQNDTVNYGPGYVCVSGQCTSGICTTSADCGANGRICATSGSDKACVTCANDTQCKNDARYGSSTLCLRGACTTGNCHDISSDCPAGRLCGSSVAHACGECTSDAQCTADARYGTGYLCNAGLCVRGNCHDTSSECAAGLVCGGATAHTCGSCANDDQCKNDTRYGAATMCATTAGSDSTGHCISNACSNAHEACAANGSDICCDDACVAGNCCDDGDCAARGTDYVCRQHTCTPPLCDNVAGTSYLVDPVHGDDATGTGSGLGGGAANAACAFRTVTRALAAIGSAPAAGTTITIVGGTTGTTPLHTVQGSGDSAPVENLPLAIPANVTVTTQTGPISLTIVGNAVGVRLLGDQARLLPITAAPLNIDGASHGSDVGIAVAAGSGTASLANVTITATGGDGIQVGSGTLQIGAGVQVTDAGTDATRKSGLVISGGTVNIAVAETDVAVLFESNTQSGISVTGSGVLNIDGVNTTGGVHSVVARGNTNDNVAFQPTANPAAAISVINGLYSFGSTEGDGLLIQGGSVIKVRNSIFQGNAGSGIRIASGGSTDAANNLGDIDLGVAGEDGHNVLQAASDPNGGAGLCVDLAGNAPSGELRAVGNQFAGVDCATASPGAIRSSTSCSATDLGLATTVTVHADNCTY